MSVAAGGTYLSCLLLLLLFSLLSCTC
jgi:hypothetical protein